MTREKREVPINQNLKSINPLRWAFISGIAFVGSLLLAIGFIFWAPRLTDYGITTKIYYVLLIPLAMSSAAFLFGAMRSYARYVGKNSFGRLELAGPVVIFGLVVLGGLYLTQPEDTFVLTIRVHGPGGKSDIISTGSVTIDLGTQRTTHKINESGEVLLTDIPTRLLNREIEVLPNVAGYQRIDAQWPKPIPTDRVIYLELKPIPPSSTLRGTVTDTNGHPLSDVEIILNSGLAKGVTDKYGNFNFEVPAAPGTVLVLVAQRNGKIGYRESITLPDKNGVLGGIVFSEESQ